MVALNVVSKSDLIALAMNSRKKVKKVATGVKTIKINDSQWNKLVQDKVEPESKAMVKARQDWSKKAKKLTKKIAKAHAPGDSAMFDVNAKVMKRA